MMMSGTPQYYQNFAAGYQGYPQAQNQRANDERVWVQNEASAEAFLMAPNSFVRLWDANRPVFYEKRSDASGRPFPIETYEYKRCENTYSRSEILASQDKNEVMEKLNDLENRIKDLEGGMNNAKSDADDSAV